MTEFKWNIFIEINDEWVHVAQVFDTTWILAINQYRKNFSHFLDVISDGYGDLVNIEAEEVDTLTLNMRK